MSEIAKHLEVCEFCDSEADLYRRFPPVEEHVEAEPIPEPLRQLAEALLRPRSDLSPLYRLLTD